MHQQGDSFPAELKQGIEGNATVEAEYLDEKGNVTQPNAETKKHYKMVDWVHHTKSGQDWPFHKIVDHRCVFDNSSEKKLIDIELQVKYDYSDPESTD